MGILESSMDLFWNIDLYCEVVYRFNRQESTNMGQFWVYKVQIREGDYMYVCIHMIVEIHFYTISVIGSKLYR